jgi:hypothetical protein
LTECIIRIRLKYKIYDKDLSYAPAKSCKFKESGEKTSERVSLTSNISQYLIRIKHDAIGFAAELCAIA